MHCFNENQVSILMGRGLKAFNGHSTRKPLKICLFMNYYGYMSISENSVHFLSFTIV